MSQVTYFDLVQRRSYRTSPSGTPYIFQKGTVVPVRSMADANFFRGQPEIFVEVDRNGNVVSPSNNHNEAKTYKRFRESLLPEDHQELLQKAFQVAVEERKQGVDVDHLLDTVQQDTAQATFTRIPAQQHVEKDEQPKSVQTKKPKVKTAKDQGQGHLQCSQCGQKFDNDQKYAAHLEDHEFED